MKEEKRNERDRGIKRPGFPGAARFVSCGAFYETNDLDDHATCHASPPGTALSCFFTPDSSRFSPRGRGLPTVQRLIPFSARPMVNEPGLSLSPSPPKVRSHVLSRADVKVRFPSDLRAIYKYRRTRINGNTTRVWCSAAARTPGFTPPAYP